MLNIVYWKLKLLKFHKQLSVRSDRELYTHRRNLQCYAISWLLYSVYLGNNWIKLYVYITSLIQISAEVET